MNYEQFNHPLTQNIFAKSISMSQSQRTSLLRPRKSVVGDGIINSKSRLRERRGPNLLSVSFNNNDNNNLSFNDKLIQSNNINTPNNQFFNAKSDLISARKLIFGSWINLLLLFVPIGIIAYFKEFSPPIVFFANFLAMIPLANILGDATECLSEHLGETIGGLLNATFGNAVELVVVVLALIKAKDSDEVTQRTLLAVVQTSLIGSIFSNSLLVLGCAFIAHGIYYKESEFNLLTASENISFLILAAFVMMLPGPYSQHIGTANQDSLMVSRAAAIILLTLYGCLLVFVLYSHADYDDDDVEIPRENVDSSKKQLLLEDFEDPLNLASVEVANGSDVIANNKAQEEFEEFELSLIGSCVLLLLSTIMVALLSEFLVGSIEPMAEDLSMSPAFIGIILLPVIGNAVEHMTAIRMAAQNKMDVAISIAIGSATQVAMFVVSLAILIAWCMGLDLDLAFNPFEVNLFLYSSIIVFTLISDGKSNWLEGAMLLGLYVLIGFAVWPQDYSSN
eukprot:940452_1